MPQPSFFTPELATAICDRLALGRSLRSVCEDGDMPSRETVRRWMRDQEKFREEVQQAFAERTDEMREDMLAIADDATLTPEDRKVRIAARQWIMARMEPRKYGDRMAVRGDPDGPPVQVEDVSVLDRARTIAFALQKAGHQLAAEARGPRDQD